MAEPFPLPTPDTTQKEMLRGFYASLEADTLLDGITEDGNDPDTTRAWQHALHLHDSLVALGTHEDEKAGEKAMRTFLDDMRASSPAPPLSSRPDYLLACSHGAQRAQTGRRGLSFLASVPPPQEAGKRTLFDSQVRHLMHRLPDLYALRISEFDAANNSDLTVWTAGNRLQSLQLLLNLHDNGKDELVATLIRDSNDAVFSRHFLSANLPLRWNEMLPAIGAESIEGFRHHLLAQRMASFRNDSLFLSCTRGLMLAGTALTSPSPGYMEYGSPFLPQVLLDCAEGRIDLTERQAPHRNRSRRASRLFRRSHQPSRQISRRL